MVSLAAESSSNKSSLTYASLCYSAGSLDHRRGRYSDALSHYQQALEIREKLSARDSNQLATSYSAVGMALTGLYRGGDAVGYFEKAFNVFDNMPDEVKAKQFNVDRYLRNRSRAKMDTCSWDDAKADLLQAEAWQIKIYGQMSHYHGE